MARAVWVRIRALALAKRLMRFSCPGSLPAVLPATSSWLDAYGVRGAYNHNWDPYWSTSLWGSYAAVRYNGNALDILSAKGQFCASFNFGKVVTADYSCNPDYNIAQVGVVTRWTPVKNLTFSAEVGAFFLDQKFTGAAVSDCGGSEADRFLRVQGPEHCVPERSRSA